MPPTEPPQKPEPGACVPWPIARQQLPKITGDEKLLQKIHQDTDALAYMYIWHCLVSF